VKPLGFLQIGCRLSRGGLRSSGLLALRAFLRLPEGAKFLLPDALLSRRSRWISAHRLVLATFTSDDAAPTSLLQTVTKKTISVK
jgi:hypothetical protein